MSLIPSSLRRNVETLFRRHPFLRLVQHFCARAGGANSTSDLDFGLGGALALLAVPGAFMTVLLMDKYSPLLQWLRGQPYFNPYLVCLSDEHFFLVYSMAVTGLVTSLRWDELLPAGRDFANLAPLPLSLSQVFLANLVALAALAALFAVDINLVSALVFPVLVSGAAVSGTASNLAVFWEFFAAHAFAVLGISAFTFLALIALQGVLMAALPGWLYRRAALLLRTVLLILFIGALLSVFLPLPFQPLNHVSTRTFGWWPPLWFLSWFESHIGALHNRSLLGPSPVWQALGSALLLAIVGFWLSYRRYFLRIPEQQSGPSSFSGKTGLIFRSAFACFRPLLRPGLETACFHFTVRTLLRSETHLLLTGLWAGVGLLVTLQGLQRSTAITELPLAPALLSAPLTFVFFSLGGLRFVFDLPSSAHANWPFRLLAAEGTRPVRAACRKLLLGVGLIPVLLIWFPLTLRQAGFRPAILYLLFHLLTLALAVELLLWKFGKVPFTCSFVPQRDRLLKIALGSVVVIFVLLPMLARIEAIAIAQPLVLALFFLVLLGAFAWLARHGPADSESLLYEDRSLESFAWLRLGKE